MLTFKLRTYNVVSVDSAPFRMVKEGDIDGLRDLLISKKASVFDTLSNGSSLLHVCLLAELKPLAYFADKF